MLLLGIIFLAGISGVLGLFYQWQEGQNSLKIYQKMQIDFDRDFESKLAVYEYLQKERLDQFIDYAFNAFAEEVIAPYEEFLSKIEKYDDFLKTIQREIIEERRPSSESLKQWKKEQTKVQEALEKYQEDEKFKRYEKKYFKKPIQILEKQAQILKDHTQLMEELPSKGNFWLWKNLFNEFRLQNKVLALEILYVTQIRIPSSCIFYANIDIMTVPSALTVAQGEIFEAEIFVMGEGVFNNQLIQVNDIEYTLDGNQRAKYVIQTSSLGKKTLKTQIHFKDGFGKERTFTRKLEYEVVPKCR